jgi:hypothetical protein
LSEGAFYKINACAAKMRLQFFVLRSAEKKESFGDKKDEELLIAIKEYLNCGYCYLRKKENAIDFKVTKFTEINEILIPFFINNPILGIKSLDFKD